MANGTNGKGSYVRDAAGNIIGGGGGGFTSEAELDELDSDPNVIRYKTCSDGQGGWISRPILNRDLKAADMTMRDHFAAAHHERHCRNE